MSITQSPLDLEDHKGRADKLQARVDELTRELSAAKQEIEDQKAAYSALEDEVGGDADELKQLQDTEADRSKAEDAIHGFLDEVTRPVGTQHFEIPQAPCIDRAIIRMHDAIGRPL